MYEIDHPELESRMLDMRTRLQMLGRAEEQAQNHRMSCQAELDRFAKMLKQCEAGQRELLSMVEGAEAVYQRDSN